MNTTIYFVRHAGYENPERVAPGRIPGYHLSDDGREKAKRVGEFFKNSSVKYIYTSPLERTFETANAISEYLPAAKIIHAYDLIEADAIHWQAYKLEDLYTNNYYEAFLNDPDTKEVPENLTQLAARMKNFALNLCAKHKGEEIICVSHQGPILALRLSLEGKPLKVIKTYDASMASITTFTFDGNCAFQKVTYKETG